jgi:hypothetical protein
MQYTVVIQSLVFIRGGGLLCAPCSIVDQYGNMPFELSELASDMEDWRPHITLLTAKGGPWRPVDSSAVLKALEDEVLRNSVNAAHESVAVAVASSDPYEDHSTPIHPSSDSMMIVNEVSVDHGCECQLGKSEIETSVVDDKVESINAESSVVAGERCGDTADSDTTVLQISLASSIATEETSANQQESPQTTVIDPSESPIIMDAIDQNRGIVSETSVAHAVPCEAVSTEEITKEATLDRQLTLRSFVHASGVEVFPGSNIRDTVVDLCVIHLPTPITLRSCSFRLFWK